MSKLFPYAVAGVLIAVAGCQQNPTSVSDASTPITVVPTRSNGLAPVAGRYIVELTGTSTEQTLQGLVSQTVGLAKSASNSYHTAFKGFVADLSAEQVAQLAQNPDVKSVEQDYRYNIAPVERIEGTSAAQDVTNSAGQITPWGVERVGGSRDGTGKVAWIIDTGVDLNNSDLNIDQTRSRNFVNDGHTTAQDGHGHGTHVAGTIAAKNNTIGVVGVAANASVVAIRVMSDSGDGLTSDMIKGLDYVAANAKAGDVVNMSVGGETSQALDDAVRMVAAKGIKVVVAAGNDGVSALTDSPARVNDYNVFTVSAIDYYSNFASFSNYGNPAVDLAAPGVAITSTRLGGGTVTMTGTSMAAPHVAGLLLFGSIHGYGYAQNDPDGIPDPIAYR